MSDSKDATLADSLENTPPSRSLDRLYNLIPQLYRQRDIAEGQPLRALLRVIAEQVNIVEDQLDQLYENWFIETCESWVIPYLGDLVGFNPIYAGIDPDPNSPEGLLREKFVFSRSEVANTIATRRRKGSMAVLESLPRQVAGWDGRVVPFYRRLRMTQHLNHRRLDRGRSLDLRNAFSLDRLGSPFDRAARLLDVRRITSAATPGRHNLQGVGVFVWRLNTFPVTRTDAMAVEEFGPNCYTFSPLGHDQQLFTRPRRDATPRHIANELNVPMPIPKYAFADRNSENAPVASSRYYGPHKSLAVWAPGWPDASVSSSQPIPRDRVIARDLTNWDFEPPQDHIAVDVERGRIVFPPRQLPENGVLTSYQYGFSAKIGGGEYDRPLFDPPDAIRLFVGRTIRPDKTTRFNRLGAALEHWQKLNPKPHHAVIEIGDSRVYSENIEIHLAAGQTLQIRAAQNCRPVLRSRRHRAGSPHLAKIYNAPGSCLVLDGLLLASGALRFELPLEAKPDAQSAPDDAATRALRRITIRHCTLVPGGGLHIDCEPRAPGAASIEILGGQLRLAIQHSIVGQIQVLEDAPRTEPILVNLSDSIVDATSADREAFGTPGTGLADAILRILRCTIIGRIETHAIALAEDSILLGHLRVARRRQGCIRFSWIEPDSRTPPQFHCQPLLALQNLQHTASWRQSEDEDDPDDARARLRQAEILRVRPQFNSLRYGSSGYCQLSARCPAEISRGASDESEMGAFHDLFQPQRLLNLQARLSEYTPVGYQIAVIPVT